MCYLWRLNRSSPVKWICLKNVEGCVGINKASHDRNLDIPDIIFSEHCNIIAHNVCRSRHTNQKSVKTSQKCLTSPSSVSKSLRSGQSVLNFKTHCLLCGDVVDLSLVHKTNIASYKYSRVMTLGFQENMHTHCQIRKDDWATQIQYVSLLMKPYTITRVKIFL